MEKENKELKKDKINNYKPLKMLIGLFFLIFFSFISLIGSIFGFISIVENHGPIDNIYNEYIQVETTVKISDPKKDVYDAADSILNTLNFLGQRNANVKVIGDERIVITNPIESYEDSENEKQIYDMADNVENNNLYLTEVESFIIPLLFNGELDFRTEKGSEIFSYGTDPTYPELGEKYYFNSTNLETDNSVSTESTESYDFNLNTRADKSPGSFYKNAKVKQINGLPVIEVEIDKSGKNGDEYINLFKDFNNWIISNDDQSTYTTNYVIWFDFYSVSEILKKLNLVDGDDGVFEYVSGNEKLRPLYLTATNAQILESNYEYKILIKGDFTQKQANYFVNKINNTSTYNYSEISFSLVFNNMSNIMLKVLAWLLILFIIIVIFSFVGYFGLLGVISSISFVFIILFAGFIYAFSGITITGLGLISFFIIGAITISMIFFVTNNYKMHNKDKFISVNKVLFNKFKESNRYLLIPIITAIILLYFAGFLLNIVLTLTFYFIAIMLVISYLIVMIMLIPLIYLIDLLTEFTRKESDKKWELLFGFNFELKNKIDFKYNKLKAKNVTVTLVGIIVLLLSVVSGLFLIIYTGNPVNSTYYGANNYYYNVKMIDENSIIQLTGEDENSYLFKSNYELIQNKQNEVIKSFEDNGIKVSSVDLIRMDNVFFDDSSVILNGSIGYQIHSRNLIDTETKALINEQLSLIQIDGFDPGFELVDSLSLFYSDESLKVKPYLQDNILKKGLFTLLIIISVSAFISIFISNWGVALASLISNLLESIFLIAPLFILFIPYNFFVWIPIILLTTFSFVIKIKIAQDVNHDEIREKRWIRNSKKRMLWIPAFSILLLVLELLLIGAYGFFVILPMILITLIAPFVIFGIQQFIYPYFANLLGDFRDEVKNNKKLSDIRKSKTKDSDQPKEEFIEGVNI